MKFGFFLTAILAATTSSFSPTISKNNALSSRSSLAASSAPEVDVFGNNLQVKSLLTNMEQSGFLTKLAQSGLLSKAKKAGISLSTLEPFINLASENPGLLVLVEAAGPDILPLLPKVVQLAPDALPLLALGLDLKPFTLQVLGLAALGAAGASVLFIPDDTIIEVAAQTLLASTLAGAGLAAFIGSVALADPVGAAKKAASFI